MEKRLYRSKDKKIFGVCGGIAEYIDADPTIIRLATAIITCCSFGFGVLAYVIAALIIPVNQD